MLGFFKIVLSGVNVKKEDLLVTGKSLWDKISFFILKKIWPFIRDYRFIIFGILIILLITIIIIWAQKHVPSRGRIIDMYDVTGEKKEKKNKKNKDSEIYDLPKEFYKRK